MQEEQYQSNDIRHWKPFIESMRGKKFNFSNPPPEEQKEERVINNPELADLIEAGERYSGYKHKQRSWKDLSDEEKKAACTRRTGRFMFSKMPNGIVDKQPIYCNLCAQCYEANALKLKSKIDLINKKAQEETPGGQWRKKTVDDDTEAQSLKKRISRNQAGRHFEVACDDNTNDIYVYVEDEPGKDMEKIYGESVNLENVDHDKIYKVNRSTGKKFSTGKAFKAGSLPGKEDTIRVMIPQIITSDISRQDEVENILHKTNYLELADTPEKAKEAYNFQLKYLIKELEDANIEIIAIKPKFYNFSEQQFLEDWNRNVKHWMSILASYSHEEGANMDKLTDRLYQRVGGKPEELLN